MKLNKKAFTLIELLVVIAIIGILATVSVIALSNARAKSRDAKRAGDVKQIQTSLELFFNDKGRYPTIDEWNTHQIFSTSSSGTSTYMQIIPSAPSPSDGSCSDRQNTISYAPSSDGSSYTISFCLGNNTGTFNAGPKCLNPGGIVDVDCTPWFCGDPVAYTGGPYDSTGLVRNQGGYYRTVQIGTQCWLKDNMNVGTMVNGNASQVSANTGTFQKYCYGNDEANCNTDGGLYQWHTAMGLAQACGYCSWCYSGFSDNGNGTYTGLGTCAGNTINVNQQGICPTGWHIPTRVELDTLSTYLGPSQAGNKVRAVTGGYWSSNTGATNSSGFTSLGVGFCSPGEYIAYKGSREYYWLATPPGGNSPYVLILDAYAAFLPEQNMPGSYGLSIRCVKN